MDVTTLTQELSSVKDKWHEIGVQLGIKLYQLSDIEDMYSTTERRLTEMLGYWLDGNTETPICWESILKCLRASTVNKKGLAEELAQKYCLVKEEDDKEQTAAETQVARPLQRNSDGDHNVPQTPIQRFAMYLKGVYSRAISTSDGKFPHLMCNQFINLALVKKEQVSSQSEADDFTKATLHGHIDEILKKKEPIKVEDVLNPVKGQPEMKCIFIEGAPGIGKSTCVGELCRRWDEIDALKKYSLVILLRLREKRVQEAQNVEDLCFHRNKKLRQAVADEIEACEGKDVLFILDGFDELPDSLRRQSMFVELIQGTYLSHCTVLVTSRPSATADFLAVAQRQIHKQIEVIGFTPENIKQYGRAFFSYQQQMLDDFLTYISTHPPIRSMMYIPLNCAIAVEIYKHNRTANRPIPKTMTQLYVEMSLTFLKRHLGEDDSLAKKFPENLEDLPPQLLKSFMSLADLAFEGLLKNEVVFHNLPVNFVHFGFMNSPTELYMGEKTLVSHSFLHLTLQEFLAAFHISQLSPSEQKGIFEMYGQTDGWDVVWRFVAGLTGFQEIGWDWEVTRNVNPFLIQYLYEAQDKVDLDSVLTFGRECEVVYGDVWGGLTAIDCYAVGYCVASSTCMWKLDFHNNKSLGGVLVEMLKHGLCSPCKSLPSSREHRNILKLYISNCTLDSTAFNQLADILPLMINLKELDIRFNPAGDGGLVKLLHSLSHLKHLHTLYMDNTDINYCTDMEALTLPTLSVKKLGVGEHRMPPESAELMFQKVLSPSSLECVVFSEVYWTDQAAALLEENCNLTRLVQWFDNSNSSSLTFLARALHKNSHLKSLSLNTSYCSLSDDVVSSLVDMLKHNQSLERLEFKPLSYSTSLSRIVNEHHLLTLNKVLQYNNTLKQLALNFVECTFQDELDPRITFDKYSGTTED